MPGILKPYILSFIPLFVAINVIGILPIFLSITQGAEERRKRIIIRKSVTTATGIALVFIFLGKGIFLVMGISLADFEIGGGIVLLVLAIQLLLPGESRIHENIDETGAVPLGTPLITGPAVLTTSLMMMGSYGPLPTIVSLILNMAIVWLVFSYSSFVIRLIGASGSRAVSKVADILLAAIAVMLIRQGVFELITSSRV